jgi:hypothetical protein
MSNPSSGRQNNQGFEGLTVSPDGRSLYVMLQSAARQEGGTGGSGPRRNARFLKYSISPTVNGGKSKNGITYEAEYVVQLPFVSGNSGRVTAQSDIHYISDTQFLILPRDSGVGRGQSDPTSKYRHVDVIDITDATNIKGDTYDTQGASITTASNSKFCAPKHWTWGLLTHHHRRRVEIGHLCCQVMLVPQLQR